MTVPIPGTPNCQKRKVGQRIANGFTTVDILLIFGGKRKIQVKRQMKAREVRGNARTRQRSLPRSSVRFPWSTDGNDTLLSTFLKKGRMRHSVTGIRTLADRQQLPRKKVSTYSIYRFLIRIRRNDFRETSQRHWQQPLSSHLFVIRQFDKLYILLWHINVITFILREIV